MVGKEPGTAIATDHARLNNVCVTTYQRLHTFKHVHTTTTHDLSRAIPSYLGPSLRPTMTYTRPTLPSLRMPAYGCIYWAFNEAPHFVFWLTVFFRSNFRNIFNMEVNFHRELNIQTNLWYYINLNNVTYLARDIYSYRFINVSNLLCIFLIINF